LESTNLFLRKERGLNRASDFYSKIVILVHKSSKGRVSRRESMKGERGGRRKKEGSIGKETVRKEVVLVISSIERTKGSFQRKEEEKMKRAILLRKISNLCPLRAFATCLMVVKLMVSLWVLDFGGSCYLLQLFVIFKLLK
jgi:hypothetical protein